jgi:CPA2 family monovalent cation:H+ antiporter-2
MLVPGIVAYFLGMSWASAFVAAAALSLSSTAIVIKQLAEQGELMTRHGELSLAILLFQDLAAVPFLIIIPVLATASVGTIGMDLGWAVVKGVIAITLLLTAGRWVLRPLFDEVAKANSQELFTLTTLLTALATAWVTHALGLSMILGAFLAGLVLAETHHRHQIEHDIRPFRDVLLGLFFVTVGMLLNFKIIAQYWYWVLFLVIAIVVFKFILISLVANKVGHLSLPESTKTGLILAHGGEFGFILLTLAITLGIMEADYGQVVLAGVLITMFICPLFIRYSDSILGLLGEREHSTERERQ